MTVKSAKKRITQKNIENFLQEWTQDIDEKFTRLKCESISYQNQNDIYRRKKKFDRLDAEDAFIRDLRSYCYIHPPKKTYDVFIESLKETIEELQNQQPQDSYMVKIEIEVAKYALKRIDERFEVPHSKNKDKSSYRSVSKKESISLENRIMVEITAELDQNSTIYGSSYYGLNKYDLRKIREELDLIQTVADAYEPSNFDIHGRRK